MKIRVTVAPLLLLVAASAGVAQAPPDPARAIAAVSEVSFLEGTWSGEGWSQIGSGPREEFTVTETVEPELDGAVMLIEGIGHSKESGEKGHHALAVIAFDPEQGKLIFSSFIAGRPPQHLPLEVGTNSLVREFSLPDGARVRYTIQIEDGMWHEIGEYSRGGESWRTFLEMHLERQ